MDLVNQNLIYKLSETELEKLWETCITFLENWEILKGTHYVFEHSECFLVGYSILVFHALRAKFIIKNPKLMREILLKRLNEEEVRKIIIIGPKDICKRNEFLFIKNKQKI